MFYLFKHYAICENSFHPHRTIPAHAQSVLRAKSSDLNPVHILFEQSVLNRWRAEFQ